VHCGNKKSVGIYEHHVNMPVIKPRVITGIYIPDAFYTSHVDNI
jgi:hypothetical protein